MPDRRQLLRLIVFLFVLMIGNSFNSDDLKSPLAEEVKGAWQSKDQAGEQVLIFIDNYVTHTAYSLAHKKFNSTKGGKYRLTAGKIQINYEFNSIDKSIIGTNAEHDFVINDGRLSTNINGVKSSWTRLDDASSELAGTWQITARMQGNELNEMRPGARKTIKILSGTRFHWAAINTETKEFSGSGGGKYTFTNGKYIENIEFFSRDSSRVGASLTFEGKIEKGNWIHKGLSSKGEKIHEVWSRPFGTE